MLIIREAVNIILIILGDTNRFGDYSATKINNDETAFHQLLAGGYVDSAYRLLTIKGDIEKKSKRSSRKIR